MTYYCESCDRPCQSRAAADECARVDAREDREARNQRGH